MHLTDTKATVVM